MDFSLNGAVLGRRRRYGGERWSIQVIQVTKSKTFYLFFSSSDGLQYKKSSFIVSATFVAFDRLVSIYTVGIKQFHESFICTQLYQNG